MDNVQPMIREIYIHKFGDGSIGSMLVRQEVAHHAQCRVVMPDRFSDSPEFHHWKNYVCRDFGLRHAVYDFDIYPFRYSSQG